MPIWVEVFFMLLVVGPLISIEMKLGETVRYLRRLATLADTLEGFPVNLVHAEPSLTLSVNVESDPDSRLREEYEEDVGI